MVSGDELDVKVSQELVWEEIIDTTLIRSIYNPKSELSIKCQIVADSHSWPFLVKKIWIYSPYSGCWNVCSYKKIFPQFWKWEASDILCFPFDTTLVLLQHPSLFLNHVLYFLFFFRDGASKMLDWTCLGGGFLWLRCTDPSSTLGGWTHQVQNIAYGWLLWK